MSELIIKSRITPKKGLKNVIFRERLSKLIDENIDKNLILVTGAAGYGKTTLVQEYLQNKLTDFAWFHITEDISSFYTFFTYVIHALKNIKSDFGETTLEAIESIKQTMNLSTDLKNIISTITGTFINEFSGSFDKDVIIVFDDLHEVQDKEWLNLSFNSIIDSFPENMHIIITTRETPSFNISKLAGKRNILAIDSSELTFNKSEIIELLKNCYSIEIGDNNSAAGLLEKKLSGWVTGIHLVLQAYGKNFADADFSNENIFSYFANEIFEKLSGTIQDFLLKTAYLNNFTAEDCNKLLDIEASGAIIEQLVNKNIFIETTFADKSSGSKSTALYNYYNLFKEYLISRLTETKDSEEINAIIKKSFLFYKQKGNYEAAINLSINAKDYGAAVPLFIEKFDEYFDQGKLDVLWKWISSFGEDMVLQNLKLAYFKGVLCRYVTGDVSSSNNYFAQILDKIDIKTNKELYVDTSLKQAETLIILGKINEARQTLSNLLKINVSEEKRVSILYQLARVHFRMGAEEYDTTEKIITEAIDICIRNGLESSLLLFYNLSGNIYRHKGEFVKALYYFENVVQQEKNVFKKFNSIINSVLLLSRTGNYEKAFQTLNEGEKIYKLFPSAHFQEFLLRASSLLRFECGDFESAVKILNELIETELRNKVKVFIYWHYLFIGESFLFLNKKELSGKYYEIAMEYIDNKDSYQKMEYGIHMAILNKINNISKETEKTLLEAHKYFEQNGLFYAKVQIEFHLADYYFKKNLPDTALKYLNDSLNSSSEKQYISYLEQLFPLYRYLFDFAISNNVQKQFIKVILNNLLNRNKIENLSEECRKRLLLSTIPSLYDISMNSFGGVEIFVRGNPIEEEKWIRKKSKLILIYLLLHPETKFTKDKILGIFFEDMSADSAENIFHQAITNIRNALKTEPEEKEKVKKTAIKKNKEIPGNLSFIIYEDKILKLNSNFSYKIDAVEFNQYYHKVKSSETGEEEKIQSVEKAVLLYKGELLAGHYEPWCEELRVNYSNKFINMCEEMTEFYKKKKLYYEVITYALKILESDKLHEQAYIDLIESYSKMDNINMAKNVFGRMLKAYDEEYGEKPSKSVLDRIQPLLTD